jgi:hypothetical protein
MAEQARQTYQILLSEGAAQDLRQMRDAAAAEAKQYGNDKDPAHNVHRKAFKETMRELEDLGTGKSNGHHVLGNHKGLGGGRDTIVSKIDDGTGANLRLTMREIPARNAGGKDARDVIAIAPRHGPDNIYQRTGQRLGRGPNQTLQELDRFGDAQVGSGGKAHKRGPILDANRAIAHAFDGQQPLAGSRPLSETDFGQRTGTGTTKQAGRARETPQQTQ